MVSDLGLGSKLWCVGTDLGVSSHGQENGWCYAREEEKIRKGRGLRTELWSLTTLPEQAGVSGRRFSREANRGHATCLSPDRC